MGVEQPTLNEVQLQAELVTQLNKRARRAATMAVQAAAKLESMVAENADQEKDSDDGHRSTEDQPGR